MFYGDLFLVEGLIPQATALRLKSLRVEGAEHARIDYPGAQNGTIAFRISGLARGGALDAVQLHFDYGEDGADRRSLAELNAWLLTGAADDTTTALLLGHLAIDQAAGRRPRVLDIGGRERSGPIQLQGQLGPVDLVVFDLLPGDNVDLVGDAHRLASHVAPESFDYVISTSVFEHLMMPWRVVLEINRVLRPGGLCFVSSHQSLGLHELPSDYWRFSDSAWRVLFCEPCGFRVVATNQNGAMALTPHQRRASEHGDERAIGFESSSVLAQKVGAARADWHVEPEDLGLDRYPV
jgi:SAM-dependent methyltransferase